MDAPGLLFAEFIGFFLTIVLSVLAYLALFAFVWLFNQFMVHILNKPKEQINPNQVALWGLIGVWAMWIYHFLDPNFF